MHTNAVSLLCVYHNLQIDNLIVLNYNETSPVIALWSMKCYNINFNIFSIEKRFFFPNFEMLSVNNIYKNLSCLLTIIKLLPGVISLYFYL